MKIGVLGINFYPELIGIAVYNTELCEYLTQQGYKVTIFTSFPYYPKWEIPKEYKGRLYMTSNYRGITVKRSYLYAPEKVTPKSRVLHEFSFAVSSFFSLFFSERPDILVTVSPPLGLGLVAYIVSRIKRVPFIFHIQDLQPDAANELGMLKNRMILKLLYKTEKFIYKKAAKVSVISKKMGEKVVQKGIKPEEVFFFPNWVDTDYIKHLPQNNIFRQGNKIEDKFLVLYSGNIGVKQGLDVILESASMTKDKKDIVYVIVGNGAYRAELYEKYERLDLENVVFLPTQSKEMLPHMLAAADVCLIPQQRTVTDIVMPSKLLGIMASGRPVIAGANVGSELYNVIDESGCGKVVEPENPKQLVGAIMEIYNDHEKRVKCGRKGREFAIKHFSKVEILKSFERKIRKPIN